MCYRAERLHRKSSAKTQNKQNENLAVSEAPLAPAVKYSRNISTGASTFCKLVNCDIFILIRRRRMLKR